jgi:hypothetical protein
MTAGAEAVSVPDDGSLAVDKPIQQIIAHYRLNQPEAHLAQRAAAGFAYVGRASLMLVCVAVLASLMRWALSRLSWVQTLTCLIKRRPLPFSAFTHAPRLDATIRQRARGSMMTRQSSRRIGPARHARFRRVIRVNMVAGGTLNSPRYAREHRSDKMTPTDAIEKMIKQALRRHTNGVPDHIIFFDANGNEIEPAKVAAAGPKEVVGGIENYKPALGIGYLCDIHLDRLLEPQMSDASRSP